MLIPGRMLEHIPGLPDLILFWMNDVSVIRVSRCGITRGTLYGKHVLTLIWVIMTDGSFKIVSNWAVLTAPIRQEAMPSLLHAAPFGAPRGALKSQNTRRTQKFIAHLSQYHAVASCLASKPTYGTCSLARASRKRTFTYRYRLKIRFFVFTSEYNLNVF